MMSEFQLLYTRISHDLAGISGPVYNGVELLSELPECNLLGLQYLRLCYN